MKNKMLVVWSQPNHYPVMIQETGKPARHYKNITPSTYERIEKLTWDADIKANDLRVYAYLNKEGLSALVIERR